MMLNPYSKAITFFLLLVTLSCSNQKIENKLYSKTFSFGNGKEVIDSLDVLLKKLSSIDPDNSSFSESAILINESIRKTIEKVKTPKLLSEISTSYYYKKHDFTFAISNNQKIGVFSWDTRIGESLINYKNIALFTINKKVVPTSLSGTPACYNEIYTLKSEKKYPIYIFHGWGKSSPIDFYYKVDAYNFRKEGLEEANIFPNKKNSMISYYNIEELDYESQMDFNIEKDGSLILKPEAWGSTIVYRPITFNGKAYSNQCVEDEIDLDYVLPEKGFEQRNSFDFLEGSEFPLAKTTEGKTDIYKFSTHLEVEVNNDFENENTEVSIHSPGNEPLIVNLTDFASLIGKKDGFLFFSGTGTPEKWPLLIYNLKSKKLVLSKHMAKATIKKENILFAELTDGISNNDIREIDCNLDYGNQKGYFNIYTFPFNKENPIVELTDQVFCRYVQ